MGTHAPCMLAAADRFEPLLSVRQVLLCPAAVQWDWVLIRAFGVLAE